MGLKDAFPMVLEGISSTESFILKAYYHSSNTNGEGIRNSLKLFDLTLDMMAGFIKIAKKVERQSKPHQNMNY